METMTVEQALDITIRILGDIQVPVSLIQQIGIPINRAISNIQQCIDAMQKNAELQKQVEAQNEPEAENESET